MWKTVERPVILTAEWNVGDIRLSINPLDDHRRSQHFGLTFCQFTEADTNSCLETWPREAIALARKKLDEFESRLDAAE